MVGQAGDADRDYRWLGSTLQPAGDQRAHRRPTVPHSSRHPALPGFDVLPPFLVHRTSRIDPARFETLRDELGKRLDHLWRTEPIAYRKQNGGDYDIPAPNAQGRRGASAGRLCRACRTAVTAPGAGACSVVTSSEFLGEPFDRTDHLLGGVLNLDDHRTGLVGQPGCTACSRLANMLRTASSASAWFCCALTISSVAVLVRAASCRTSSATTAKPRPWSPALAASMAAFNASRLVCAAIPPMVWTMELISSDCFRAPRCHRWRTAPGR